jgi:chemotaxis protein MotA
MIVIVGIFVVLGSVIAGYTMHGGHLGILIQPTEMIIILGAALGSLLISNPMSVTKAIGRGVAGAMKGSGLAPKAYEELLAVLHDLFQVARREGIVALEQHIENPKQSAILRRAPSLLANHHALEFLCDTLRTVVSGNVDPHDLEELMDRDLETIHVHELRAPQALTTLGDALPGLGIVAAVLGVVITMGKIDQPPAVIGHSIAAALVGTFLGILMCYGFAGPLAKAIENHINAQGRYLACIKAALLVFAKGPNPAIAVEYARRAITPEERPSFAAAEKIIKKT